MDFCQAMVVIMYLKIFLQVTDFATAINFWKVSVLFQVFASLESFSIFSHFCKNIMNPLENVKRMPSK